MAASKKKGPAKSGWANRAAEQKLKAQEHLREVIASGSLVVRQATPEERAEWERRK